MELPIYQVDAFTQKVFSGNPAAVVPLKEWFPDDVMQAVAAENNLAETAFFMPKNGHFAIRWFTPEVEVDLCGHATLASAFVLYEQLGFDQSNLVFESRSGELQVKQEQTRYVLNFPAIEMEQIVPSEIIIEALGKAPLEVFGAMDYLVVYSDEKEIREMHPEMELLKKLDRRGVIITAPGDEVDFVSRFFAPNHGIPEDAVTGSAHCALVPYWAKKLDQRVLTARQISRRGGELYCEEKGDRVLIAGDCSLYMKGTVFI